MSVGVSHTFGGNVVVVDMLSATRWFMTPEMAIAGAERCERAISGDAVYAGIAVAECLDGRAFRFAGRKEDFDQMAVDLRKHAAAAREKAVAND